MSYPQKFVRIQPSRGWVPIKFNELWEYRELLYFLTWRDIKVRYKQTALGVIWAILQPLLTMAVFTLFFGKLAGMDTNGVPAPIFYLGGIVPWTFFSNAITQSSNSLVQGANLIRKVYFPRLTVPTASVMGGSVDFVIAFLLLLVFMSCYGIVPTANVIWLPLLVLLTFCTALAVGVWLSALNVYYRDVRYVVPFIAQFWMFASPIAYSSTLLPEKWQALYAINPMVGVVEGFRWALFGTNTSPGPMIIVSSLASMAALVSGAFYFRRMEKTFADVV